MLGKILNVDYGYFGVLTVFIMYYFREKKVLLSIAFGLLIFGYYYLEGAIFNTSQILSMIFTWIPILIIMFYNGKLGKKVKYFFYWFYPIHMILIYFLSLINI